MEKLIHGLSDFLTSQLTNFEVLREFGFTPADGPEFVARIESYIEKQALRHLPAEPDITLIVNDQVIQGADHVANAIHSFTESNINGTILLGDEIVSKDDGFSPDQWETVWEKHGWNYVHEFLDAIPQMDKGQDYCFFFLLTEEKISDGIAFPLFMISTMLLRANSDNLLMRCIVEKSTDGQNHFVLMYKSEA